MESRLQGCAKLLPTEDLPMTATAPPPISPARPGLWTTLSILLVMISLAAPALAQKGAAGRERPRSGVTSLPEKPEVQELEVPLGGTARLVLEDRNARSLTDVRVLDARGGKTSPSRYLTAVLGRTQRDGSRTLMVQASTRATPGTDYVLQGVMGKTTITLDVKVEVLAAGVKPAERSSVKSKPAPKGRPSDPVLKDGLPDPAEKRRLPETGTRGSLPGSTIGERTSKPAPGGRLPGSGPRGGGPTAGGKGSQPGRAAVVLGRGSSTRLELRGGDFARILKLRVLRDGKVDRSASVTLERPGREVILNLHLGPDAPLVGERSVEAMIDQEWQELPIDVTVVEDSTVTDTVDSSLGTTLIQGGGRVSVVDRGAREEERAVPPGGYLVDHFDTGTWGTPITVRAASQQFYAKGNLLEQIQIPMGGGVPVTVRVVEDFDDWHMPLEGAQASSGSPGLITLEPKTPVIVRRDDGIDPTLTLFEETLTAPESAAVITLQPETPVTLRPGRRYRIEIQPVAEGEDIVLHKAIWDIHCYEDTYVRTGAEDEGLLEFDLNMEITGRSNTLKSRPTRRALLIISDSDGMTEALEAIDSLRLGLPPVPYMVFPSTGEPTIELRMNPGETVFDAIQRLKSSFLDVLGDAYAGGGNMADQLLLEMYNPINWRIEYEDFSDTFGALTDEIPESITRSIARLANFYSYGYQEIVHMEDSEVLTDQVIERLRSLCQDHVVDIHILTRGVPGAFLGPDINGTPMAEGTVFDEDSFFRRLYSWKHTGQAPLDIRVVYQVSSASGSLKEAWLGLGAEAVSGTRGLATSYLPHQYAHFVDRFIVQGYSFHDATRGAYNDAVAYTEPILRIAAMFNPAANTFVDQLLDDSRLTVRGRGHLTHN